MSSGPGNTSPPRDMSSPPSSPSDSLRGGTKVMAVNVQYLDDTVQTFQIQAKACGRVLFDQACKVLSLLEVDYFGLEYSDDKATKFWLDYEKPIYKQLRTLARADNPPLLFFSVKFYTPDPAQLEEEFTRYLFSLQVKRDLAQGYLHCNDQITAILASYIVQSECGDYSKEDYPDPSYLTSYKFVPHQTPELEKMIMENHKKHIGQSPTEADLNLLETARRCELYGLRLTPAKDLEGVSLNLAVAHMGVLVFQNQTKITTFSWAKIRKLSFKRKRFLIKLHPEGYYKDTVEYIFDSRNNSKNFWKRCIENHAFFRCSEVRRHPRLKKRIFSRGSSFRYSGRTQKQVVEFIRDNYTKRQPFQRSTSLRISSTSRHHHHRGDLVAAQPILPGSQSCGSVALCPQTPSPARERPISQSEPSSPHLTNGNVPAAAVSSDPLPTKMDMYETPVRDTEPVEMSSPDVSEDTPVLQPSPQKPPVVEPVVPPSPPVRESPLPTSPCQTASPPLRAPNGELIRAFSSDDEMVKTTASSPPPTTIQEFITSSPRLTCDPDNKRKRLPGQKFYFISKELLMTERTYKKDLEVVNVWFRDEIIKEENLPMEVLNILFSLLDPLYEWHCRLLRELEQRLAAWEGRGGGLPLSLQGVGDIFLKNITMLEHYESYIERLPLVLERLQATLTHHAAFEMAYRDFELQKVCYLPLTTFILRPALRLVHYQGLFQRMLTSYEDSHADYPNCQALLTKLEDIVECHASRIEAMKNYVKLMELQRDLTGIDNLVCGSREFIREGSLYKYSRKGFQTRMFFLFSDMVVYTSRAASQLQFRCHGQVRLSAALTVEETSSAEMEHGFSLAGEGFVLQLGAAGPAERKSWVTDLRAAIARAPSRPSASLLSGLRSSSCSSERLDRSMEGDLALSSEGLPPQAPKQRSNTTVHVCWHRSITLGRQDYARASYLSGYLLRKFRNNSRWQKLWVVFTNFCLFFYKSHQDEFPLASLPVLGYTVTAPSNQDNITKEHVFKIQYKTHAYFFRAESDYPYSRWVETIRQDTMTISPPME